MKKHHCEAAIISFCIFLVSSAAVTAGEPLNTWDGSTGKAPIFYAASGNEASMHTNSTLVAPNGEKVIEISMKELKRGGNPWDVQLNFHFAGGLKAEHAYEFSMLCKATEPGTISMVAALADSPWTPIPNAQATFETSKEWKTISFVFTTKKDISGLLALPRMMLAGHGAPSTLFFGAAKLWDLADKPKPPSQGNLIFNSGFELGNAGYASMKYLYMPRNPEMKYEGAEIDGSTYASGKHSMKLTSRHGDEARLYPHEFHLQPGTKYTLSLWLKSEQPNTPVNTSFLSATAQAHPSWAGGGHTFSASTEWKRYSFSFETKQSAAFNPYILWVTTGAEPLASTAAVWIDDIQLDQGNEKPYAPGDGVEAACIPKSNFIISQDGNAIIPCVLKAVNNSKNDVETTISVFATDDYSGKAAFTKSLALKMKADEVKEIQFDMTMTAYGSYILDAKLIASSTPGMKFRSQASCVGVLGPYECKTIDLDKTPCIGFNGPSVYVYGKNLTTKNSSYRAIDCSPDDYAERLKMMGCRLLRDWCGTQWFTWGAIESENGKYDFRHTDAGINIFARHGICVLPVIDPGLNFKETPPPWEFQEPEWMREMKRNSEQIQGIGDYKNVINSRIVPEAKWRMFVSAVAKHFKGRLNHYEIFNEPNLICPSPDIYIKFLKAASEEIRTADSNAKIVGFCSTGDLGGNVERFFDECFKLDGMKYADIASWHPYFARELSSKTPADRQIADIKALFAKYNRPELPLWNSENFWIYGTVNEDLPLYKAHHAVRKFITDIGEGVAQTMPVEEYTVWKDMLTPEFKNRNPKIIAMQPLPSANYVAYNALARFFEGAKPIGKWRWFDSAICYAFEKDGHSIAAFWNYANRNGELQMQLPKSAIDIELFDIFGNKLPFNGQPLAIDIAPYYLKWKNKNTAAVKALIENAVVSGAKPFSIERCLFLEDTAHMLFSIRNISGKSIENATLIINSADKSEVGAFAPMALKEIEVPVKNPGDTLHVDISGAEKYFTREETPVKVRHLSIAAGKPSAFIPIEKCVIGKQPLPEDLSASFAVKYEGNTVHLKVRVNDDKRSEPAKEIWNEDAVQLYLDAVPMQAGAKYPDYADTTYKIEVAAWREGDVKVNANGFPGKIEAVTTELQNGHELSISLKFDGVIGFKIAKGMKMGFDLSIDDSDGKSRKTELVWSGTADNYRNRSQFAILEFK
ncbi:MAG: carbohydrate binding domain-containing protein [Spirochaetes bacterium]|nr:carbohydrate binding domain-containing protein [Spirochaetota bacterium]